MRNPLQLAGSSLLSLLFLALSLLAPTPALPQPPGAAPAPPAQQDALVQALRRGGVVALIRHSATDPGVGDPPGFRVEDCATQRNLNDAGRAQARRLGDWFRQHGITPTAVRTSPYCRTRDTARLAFGSARDWSALSNLLNDRSRQDEQQRQVREAIAGVGATDLEVLVSHGVSINAFVDVYLQQGEMVVVRPAGIGGTAGAGAPQVEVVGRLLVP